MSGTTPGSTSGSTSGSTPEEIEAELARTREEMAQTVDQLQAKLDVKARAGDKAAELKDRATTDDGKPRPEVIGTAVGLLALAVGIVWWRRSRR